MQDLEKKSLFFVGTIIKVRRLFSMEIFEQICGLFPFERFSFPEGEYDITVSNTIYPISCKDVVQLHQKDFDHFPELKNFYQQIYTEQVIIENSYGHDEDTVITIDYAHFLSILKEMNSDDNGIKRIICKLVNHNYLLNITVKHEFDSEDINYIDYIKQIRDDSGMKFIEHTFLTVTQIFHDCVTILRAPYITTNEINRFYVQSLFSYFTDVNAKRITNIVPFLSSFWEPNTEGLAEKVTKYFSDNGSIQLEELFMAKAKVYSRLNNSTMAIIYAAIALDIIVPEFTNKFLKIKGVDRDSIIDFNNKFGLSVRVKALLKIMIPKEKHWLLLNVAKVINYRNKIMHEGKLVTNIPSQQLDSMINDSELLVNELKTFDFLLCQGRS